VIYQTPEYTKAVLAERERDIQRFITARNARRAGSESPKSQGRRRRRIRLRDPLRA
jgi:hypothetical protein